jgi:hypothetical protein
MAADVVMYGAITVPMQTREEWMSQLLQHDDVSWLAEVGQMECTLATPELAIEALKGYALEPHDRVEVDWLASTLALECSLSFDTYLQLGQTVCQLVASCEPFQGFGALTILGHRPARFGFRLAVSRKGLNFQRLSIDQRLAEESSPAFAQTMVRTAHQFDRLVGRRSGSHQVNPFTGHAA